MAAIAKYRTTKHIVIPANTNVVFVSHMKQDVRRKAYVYVRIPDKDMHYEWLMHFDDALELGLIEKVDE